MQEEIKNSIGVLIPTKNRRALLEKALLSVFNQDVLPAEIIIINDGSTDDTKKYLDSISAEHKNLKVINYQESRGVNFARNQGIKLAKVDWLIFLDDDDQLAPAAISLVKGKIEEVPEDYFLICFNSLIRKDNQESEGGFQFAVDQNYYDPSYENVMMKYKLQGAIGSVFRKKLFDDEKYFFPEIVNGFESITMRLMARDNKKIRYYKDISTIINLDSTFEHLSMKAAVKDPKGYLAIHLQDLSNHREFFRKYPKLLVIKYIDIAKLAFRSRLYYDMFLYIFYSICIRFGFIIFPSKQN